MEFAVMTDAQFIAHVRARGDLTPVELELTTRLERALDELDLCVRASRERVELEPAK